jgi:hypothetical protein
LHRLHGGILEELAPSVKDFLTHHGISPAAVAANGFYQILLALALYGFWSLLIGLGSPLLGMALVLGALVLLIAKTLKNQALDSPKRLAAWLAIAVLPVWAGIFWNHTLLHPFFMARLLVVFLLATATALLAKKASAKSPAARAASRSSAKT